MQVWQAFYCNIGELEFLNLSSVKTNKSVFYENLSENIWKLFSSLPF